MQPLTGGAAGVLLGVDAAWSLVVAAADLARAMADAARPSSFSVGDGAQLVAARPDDPAAVLDWRPGQGWALRLQRDHPQHAFVDLYLPVCSATAARPITVGHLGQSLDGFIATRAGDSQFVTGPENIVHLHRMRALSDAVVVGAGTVAADDPLLTTRQVTGPNPVRVVFDPGRRLDERFRIFADADAPTLYACLDTHLKDGETRLGRAEILPLAASALAAGASPVQQLLDALRARGCDRVFVEGGGVTVSAFLEAGLLDRLQMAVAPLIVGSGKPAIRLEPKDVLSDCQRPAYRVFRMGGDVLFDCDLTGETRAGPPAGGIERVI
jgi:diaminohydroxyphosphoribosylaminopyrimidine deaminase / 5-amino-6-(5-phosphoribosylamino)uracil reductase